MNMCFTSLKFSIAICCCVGQYTSEVTYTGVQECDCIFQGVKNDGFGKDLLFVTFLIFERLSLFWVWMPSFSAVVCYAMLGTSFLPFFILVFESFV